MYDDIAMQRSIGDALSPDKAHGFCVSKQVDVTLEQFVTKWIMLDDCADRLLSITVEYVKCWILAQLGR